MDDTKEYIEKCRKAVEIQEYWHNSSHMISEWARSYFVSPKDGSLIHYYDFESYPQHSTGYTWLPLQGQLQDMLDYELGELHYRFYDYVQKEGHNPNNWETALIKYKSMEQLWLAFVMHEKYDKKWNEEDWTTKDLPKPQNRV